MKTVASGHPGVMLFHGDCRDVLAELPDASVDAVVTDPPYGLEFMGREWDRPWAVSATNSVGYAGRDDLQLPAHRDSRNANCRSCGGRQRGAKRCTCEQPQWDRDPAEDMRAFQYWCQAWAVECLRVLKPGGHLLAFGGTRTYHRLTCAIEDAGFEIRDEIAWLYGSGFPKSLDVSKAIDKAAGAEREVVGPKAFADGTSARRTQRLGTGVFNDPASRESNLTITAPATDDAKRWQGWGTALKPAHEPIVVARKPLAGTVAANVLAHGTGAINVDACRNEHDEPAGRPSSGMHGKRAGIMGETVERFRETTAASTAGRWPTNVVLSHAATPDGADACADDCVPGCPVAELDAQSGVFGGASRFFPVFRYQAKAPTRERPKADGVAHPTVKPLALMRWLVRLVTRPGGVVLDLFAGSGTTAEAAIAEGFRCILAEQYQPYIPLIQQRLTSAES